MVLAQLLDGTLDGILEPTNGWEPEPIADGS
jgi:hypothetical protein